MKDKDLHYHISYFLTTYSGGERELSQSTFISYNSLRHLQWLNSDRFVYRDLENWYYKEKTESKKAISKIMLDCLLDFNSILRIVKEN